MRDNVTTPPPTPKKKTIRNLGLILIILVIAVPLGIFAVGTAYGEWGSDELQAMLGYVPSGVQAGESLWHAPLPDYGFGNLDPNVGYWLSAVIGVAVIIVVMFGIGKLAARKEVHRNATA